MKSLFIFLGRFFLSLVFIVSAIQKGIDWNRTETETLHALSEWHTRFPEISFLAEVTNWVPFLLIIAMLLEFVGALLVLLNIRVKLGAFFLLLFMVPATLLFHPFWFLEGMQRDIQIVMFLKNLAIIGGLFLLLGSQKKEKPCPTMESSNLQKED